jgi:hypothetical protein
MSPHRRDLVRRLVLAGAHELGLLLGGLESAVTVLGRGVDELEVEGLVVRAAGSSDDGLSHGDHALLAASNAALEHNPVLVDNTVVGEATHGGDALLGEVVLGRGGGSITLLADTQDALVDLGSVVVAHLTGAGASVANAGRVPGTDTGDLTQTTVGLAGQAGDAPTGHHTIVTLTLGDGADINSLTLSEDGGDSELLLEKLLAEVDLGGDRATVDLDLEKVRDLAAQVHLADLGVAQGAHNSAVVGDAVKLELNILGLLSGSLGVLGEGFLLGSVPVLVEATLELVTQVAGPDGGQGAQTGGGLDVADQTDDDHGRGLQDGDGLDGLLLVQLGAGSVDLSYDVGHTSLKAHEGGHVTSLGGVILREGADTAVVVLGALSGGKLHRTMTGGFIFAVRHFCFLMKMNNMIEQ